LSRCRKHQASKALEMKRAWQLFLLGKFDLSVFGEHGPSSRDIEKFLFIFRVCDTRDIRKPNA
jgi:hypothetical protein